MNLLDLDLNLLVALDALLSERSVTRAAERLKRSQPALSASLKRLRHQFRDELLVRVGNEYGLTPLGTQLKDNVGLVLADVERVFATRAQFDAARSTREFTVVTSDYGLSVLGRAVASLMAQQAPHARLRFVPVSDRMVDSASDSLRAVDGIFLPHGFLRDLPYLDAYRDRWMCLVAAENDRVGDSLRLSDLPELEWVLAFHRPGSDLPPVRQLLLLGIEIKVVISVEGFLALPAFIAGTNRVTFVQRALAQQFVHQGGLRALECPFDVVPLDEAFWWHPTLEHDPGHQWFRSVIRAAGAGLTAPDEPG